MKYTKGELYLVSETEYDHIIYQRDKPNRRDKIIARFVNKGDALLFLAAPDTTEALKAVLPWAKEWIKYLRNNVGRGQGAGADEVLLSADKALQKAEGK